MLKTKLWKKFPENITIHYPAPKDWIYPRESLTGFGLGGSCIAMFGRIGGGIYTKAADVSDDLVGKVRLQRMSLSV